MTAELAQQKCDACRGDSPQATPEEVATWKRELPDWEIAEVDGVPRLKRSYEFAGFADALAFTERVGALAEEEGHHPKLVTEWGRVTVSWWTHKIGGLHRNDFIMAAKTDTLAAERTA